MNKVLLVFAGSYLAFNIACGLVCMIIFLVRERRITEWLEFLMVGLLPCVGLGVWAYRRRQRLGKPLRATWPRMVLVRLSLLNVLYVTIIGTVIGTWTAIFLHDLYITATTPEDPTSTDMAEMLAGAIFMPVAALMGGSVVLGAIGITAALCFVMVAAPLLGAFLLRFLEPDPIGVQRSNVQ